MIQCTKAGVSSFQRSAAIRTQAMAGVFRQDLRYLHQIVEVPTAAQTNLGHQIRTEEVADWGDCF